jgi:hypothetical protein
MGSLFSARGLELAQLKPRPFKALTCYRTAVAANFFTMASSSLRSLSFKFDE